MAGAGLGPQSGCTYQAKNAQCSVVTEFWALVLATSSPLKHALEEFHRAAYGWVVTQAENPVVITKGQVLTQKQDVWLHNGRH